MADTSKTLVLHSQRELAEFFGVHPKTIPNWIDKGMPVRIVSPTVKAYDPAEIARWVVATMVKARGVGGDDETQENARRRKLVADADRTELKAATEKGDFISKGEHLGKLWTFARTVRDELRGLGETVAKSLPSLADAGLAGAAVDAALEPLFARLAARQPPPEEAPVAEDGEAGE